MIFLNRIHAITLSMMSHGKPISSQMSLIFYFKWLIIFGKLIFFMNKTNEWISAQEKW